MDLESVVDFLRAGLSTEDKVKVLTALHSEIGAALREEQHNLAGPGWRVVKVETSASCMVDESWAFLVPDVVTPEDLDDDPIETLTGYPGVHLLYVDDEVDQEENRTITSTIDPHQEN